MERRGDAEIRERYPVGFPREREKDGEPLTLDDEQAARGGRGKEGDERRSRRHRVGASENPAASCKTSLELITPTIINVA